MQTREEDKKKVPPAHVRYRIGIQLDKLDIVALLNEESDDNNSTEMSPLQRFCMILVQLTKYIKQNIDPNALYVSWKNSEDFTVMPMHDKDEFPKETVKVSTFF